MRILAIDTSGRLASCSLYEDGREVASCTRDSQMDHSRTILPLCEEMVRAQGLTFKDIDAYAAAVGPGSFTGIRIGVAAAKGLSWGGELPLCGVSTLEAMALGLGAYEGIVCPVMDARRSQVYNALFRAEGGKLTRIAPDRAISLEELGKELSALPGPVFLVGDGSYVTHKALPGTVLPPEHRLHQRAAGVALAAEEKIASGESCDGAALTPNYLRLSQAERERLEKQKK